VLVQFEKRRRRSLTPALGWSASDNPGKQTKYASTLKSLSEKYRWADRQKISCAHLPSNEFFDDDE